MFTCTVYLSGVLQYINLVFSLLTWNMRLDPVAPFFKVYYKKTSKTWNSEDVNVILESLSQLTCMCPKTAIETLEKGKKNVQN